MLYLTAFSKILPILLLILLGIGLRLFRLIQPGAVEDIRTLIVKLTLPALLFLAFSQVTIEPQYLLIVVIIFLSCLAALLIGRGLRPLLGVESVYFPTLLTGFEAGMMGYAIFGAVYGSENIYKFGLIDLGQVLFVFFILVPYLESYAMGAKPFGHTLQNFFKTPVILAILTGLVFGQTGLKTLLAGQPLFDSLLATLALVGNLTTPLVALTIGYGLHLRAGNLRLPAMAVAIRLLLWVPAAFLFNYFIIGQLLHLDQGFMAAVLTMAILPPPFVIPIFMTNTGEADRVFVLNSLTLASLATLFLYSLVPLLYPL